MKTKTEHLKNFLKDLALENHAINLIESRMDEETLNFITSYSNMMNKIKFDSKSIITFISLGYLIKSEVDRYELEKSLG